jgi:hypothetical protein
MKKKKISFKPVFAPTYVEVISVDKEGTFRKMAIARNIEYSANHIRVYIQHPV